MDNMIPPYAAGEVWTVLGLEYGVVAILAGPFNATTEDREYLVAPIYEGSEDGFVWTDEDVRIEAHEGPFEEQRFVAIWNARPVLEKDFFSRCGRLNDEATTEVRDVYWASLSEQEIKAPNRLGRRIRSPKDAAAVFQSRELKRWEGVSARVLELTHAGEVEEAQESVCRWLLGECSSSFDFNWQGYECHVAGREAMWLLDVGGVELHDWILPEPDILAAEPHGVRAVFAASNVTIGRGAWSFLPQAPVTFRTVVQERFSLDLEAMPEQWEGEHHEAAA